MGPHLQISCIPHVPHTPESVRIKGFEQQRKGRLRVRGKSVAMFGWLADIQDGMSLAMLMSQIIKRVLLGLIAAGLAAFAGNAYYQTQPSQMIARLLKLDRAPPSMTNAVCESWGVTDVLSTCSFEVDPEEFATLLTGWPFNENAASGGSHSYLGGPRVGREFPVATEYSVSPDEFEHGGRVSIIANDERSLVQLDYYEE